MKPKKKDIIQLLKKEILDLRLEPGALLSEALLTNRFGLSRTPIRDILKQLASEGYVEIFPQKGSLVSYIDLDSVEQLIYLRCTLEKELFKDLKAVMTLPMIHKLNAIINQQMACIQESADIAAFLEQDDLFHYTCYNYTGHGYLWQLIQQANVHYLRYRNLNMRKATKLVALVDEHRLLLDYLSGNETTEIDSLITSHLKSDFTAFGRGENFEHYIAH